MCAISHRVTQELGSIRESRQGREAPLRPPRLARVARVAPQVRRLNKARLIANL